MYRVADAKIDLHGLSNVVEPRRHVTLSRYGLMTRTWRSRRAK